MAFIALLKVRFFLVYNSFAGCSGVGSIKDFN
jgi:hypothetical protein